MKKILLLCAFFLAPLSYAVELNDCFQEEIDLSSYKKKAIKIKDTSFLHLEVAGNVVIEFIAPDAQPTVDIYYKENMINFVSVNYEENDKNLSISFKKYTQMFKDCHQDFMVFHIKIPYLNECLVGGNCQVVFKENDILRKKKNVFTEDANGKGFFTLKSFGNAVVRLEKIKAHAIQLSTRDASRIDCKRIEVAKLIVVEMHDTSSLFVDELVGKKARCLLRASESTLTEIGFNQFFELLLFGGGNSNFDMIGRVKQARIVLANNAKLSNRELRIKMGTIDLTGRSLALVTIEKILEEHISKNAMLLKGTVK